MKFLLAIALMASLNSCATFTSLGSLATVFLNSKAKNIERKLKEDSSPYTTRRVKVCKKNWMLLKKCEWVAKVVRKDGRPMSPAEEREFNQQ